MNTHCDPFYQSFDLKLKRVSRAVTRYILSEREYKDQINELAEIIKDIYEKNHECFQYVFEKFYSDNKNPFLSAYKQFIQHNLTYFQLASCILERYTKEYKSENEYITF